METSLGIFALGLLYLPLAMVCVVEPVAFALFGVVTLGIFGSAIVTRFWERNHRVRLLPDGIRITEWGVTRNLRAPEILHPHTLGNQRLKFKVNGTTETLSMKAFKARDKAILIEHLSQFLTTEQQARCGERWARVYAQLITTQKPTDWLPILLDLWKWLCLLAAGCILASPLVVEALRIHCPADVSPWDIPEVQGLFYFALWLSASIVIAVPAVSLAIVAFGYGSSWLYNQLTSTFDQLFLETRWILSRIRRRVVMS
jgi:hypothetical protein